MTRRVIKAQDVQISPHGMLETRQKMIIMSNASKHMIQRKLGSFTMAPSNYLLNLALKAGFAKQDQS